MIFKLNKKGFTMVELLVAMAIMGLLIIMAFPTIRAIQTNNTKTKYKEYGKSVVSAAKIYTDSYAEDLFNADITNEFKIITLQDLVKKDLIKDINLSDSSCINGKSNVTVVKYKDDYAYCLHLYCTPHGDETKKLYEEENRTGSCQNFEKVNVKYKYAGKTEMTASYEIIKGDDSYIVLHPNVLTGFTSAMKNDHQAFDNKWSSSLGDKSPGDKVKIDNDIVFTAKTHPYKYTVKYTTSGLTGVTGTMADTPCTYGVSCPLRTPVTFKKDYYTFDKWKYNSLEIPSNANLQTDFIAKNKLDITSDNQVLNLTTIMRKNVLKVGYNSNGGSLQSAHSNRITLASNVIKVDNNAVHHTLNYDGKLSTNGLSDWNNTGWINIKKTGYSIKSGEEWNTKAAGNGTTFNQTSAYTAKELCPNLKTGDCNVTMHAKWITKQISVKFDCNGGTGGTTQSFTYGVSGQKFNTSASTCTHADYNLVGWKNNKNSTSRDYTLTNNVGDGWIDSNFPSITIYAHWEPKTYTCSAGKYLPKNKTTCETCTSGNYCLGGTWAKSTTTDQGLTACPSGYTKSAPGSTKDTQCYMEVSENKYVKTAKDSFATACESGYEKEAHNVYYGNTSVCVQSCGPITLEVHRNTGNNGGKCWDCPCATHEPKNNNAGGAQLCQRCEFVYTIGGCTTGLEGSICYQQAKWVNPSGWQPADTVDCNFMQTDYAPGKDGVVYNSNGKATGHACFKSPTEWYYYRSNNYVWIRVCNKVGDVRHCVTNTTGTGNYSL